MAKSRIGNKHKQFLVKRLAKIARGIAIDELRKGDYVINAEMASFLAEGEFFPI